MYRLYPGTSTIYNHRARGQGDYISDIARVAGYNQYNYVTKDKTFVDV